MGWQCSAGRWRQCCGMRGGARVIYTMCTCLNPPSPSAPTRRLYMVKVGARGHQRRQPHRRLPAKCSRKGHGQGQPEGPWAAPCCCAVLRRVCLGAVAQLLRPHPCQPVLVPRQRAGTAPKAARSRQRLARPDLPPQALAERTVAAPRFGSMVDPSGRVNRCGCEMHQGAGARRVACG